MNNIISLLRFRQSIVAQQFFSHWAILLTEINFTTSDGIEESRATIFHITRNTDGERANFEFASARISDWQARGVLLNTTFVGATDLARDDVEKICRKVAREFVFNKFDSNCQNFAKKCIEEMGLQCPNKPSNECTCIHVVQLSSDKLIKLNS